MKTLSNESLKETPVGIAIIIFMYFHVNEREQKKQKIPKKNVDKINKNGRNKEKFAIEKKNKKSLVSRKFQYLKMRTAYYLNEKLHSMNYSCRNWIKRERE